MVLVMRVTIPAGVGPGQKVNFQTPDGRTASVVVPFGVLPGQMMNVNVPDPMPYLTNNKRKTLKAPKDAKVGKKRREFDSDDDDSDSDDSDDSDSGSREGGDGWAPKPRDSNRVRRDAANKAVGRFSNMVDDRDFEYSIKEQERLIEEKKVLDKKQKRDRAIKLAARAEEARIKAEAAAAALEDESDGEEADEAGEFTIESIENVKKGPNGLVFEVKWRGFKEEDNTWEAEDTLHDELVADYKRDYPDLVAEAAAGAVEIEIAGE